MVTKDSRVAMVTKAAMVARVVMVTKVNMVIGCYSILDRSHSERQ